MAREEKESQHRVHRVYRGHREDDERGKGLVSVEPGPARASVLNKRAATEQAPGPLLRGLRAASVTSVLRSSLGYGQRLRCVKLLSFKRPQFAIEIRGRRVSLGDRTLIMGVLNVTPDSFSDGGRYLAPDRAIEHGLELAKQGADWIDVGGESTRPGSTPITAEEELARVLPVIRGLHRRRHGLTISIDTTKADVAEQALRAGASIINDVSGLRFDARIAQVAAQHNAPLVLMHLRGRPATMQEGPFARSVWRSVGGGLAWSVRQALDGGVRRSQLIIDPGLGFGKTRRQNFQILAQLDRLRHFRLPILVGTSRKSFVQAIVAGEGLEVSPGKKGRSYWVLAARELGLVPTRAQQNPATGHPPGVPLPLLVGDAAAVAASILAGAHVVRVHDVAGIVPAVRIADAVLESRKPKVKG